MSLLINGHKENTANQTTFHFQHANVEGYAAWFVSHVGQIVQNQVYKEPFHHFNTLKYILYKRIFFYFKETFLTSFNMNTAL